MKQNTLQCGSEQELFTEIKKLFHARAARMHTNYYGPKIYTDLQRVALLVLHARAGYSLRRFCDETLRESRWPQWLGLRELPTKSTLHDWMKRFDMQFIRALNARLLADERPELLAIDGTGLDAWRRSRHYEKRIGASPMRFHKLDVLIRTRDHVVFDWHFAINPRHDAHVAKQLLGRAPPWGALILGDKGYDGEPLHKLVARNGNTLFAPVRERARHRVRGFHRQRCSKGHPSYHQRSNVESFMHRFKNRAGSLRSKLPHMKQRELAWHVLAHNLRMQLQVLLSVWQRYALPLNY